MYKYLHSDRHSSKLSLLFLLLFISFGCTQETREIQNNSEAISNGSSSEKPEYFLLRPDLEKTYGYTQAVRIGNIVKIGGVISIDDKGNPMGNDDFLQQLKNCYASLEKVLTHYDSTFDDVILENLYTTNMSELHKNASYRHEIYKNHFPTGSWIGVNELGMPEALIEIEIEAYIQE